jgi:hypothetical protein
MINNLLLTVNWIFLKRSYIRSLVLNILNSVKNKQINSIRKKQLVCLTQCSNFLFSIIKRN